MDIIQALTQELQVEKWQIEAAVKLIDEGNTIPFISRYRKEATGSLNDEILRNLHERLLYLRNLEDKKKQVLSSIEEQGKLTEELKKSILEAQTLVVVEDLSYGLLAVAVDAKSAAREDAQVGQKKDHTLRQDRAVRVVFETVEEILKADVVASGGIKGDL